MGLLDESTDLQSEFDVINNHIRQSYIDLDAANLGLIREFNQTVRNRMTKSFELFREIAIQNKIDFKFHRLYNTLEDRVNALDGELLLEKGLRQSLQDCVLELRQEKGKLVQTLKYIIKLHPELTFDEDIYKIINETDSDSLDIGTLVKIS